MSILAYLIKPQPPTMNIWEEDDDFRHHVATFLGSCVFFYSYYNFLGFFYRNIYKPDWFMKLDEQKQLIHILLVSAQNHFVISSLTAMVNLFVLEDWRSLIFNPTNPTT
jgi:hypothetical protein